MNEYESAAMWQLYATRNAGIAIQTTYTRLFDAIPEEGFTDFMYFTKVKYIDYDRDVFVGVSAESDGTTAFFHK
jgi:hypothetical protein